MTYDYKSKYLAQLILRYDGSPNFPETKRWGAFPGISRWMEDIGRTIPK